MSLAASDLFTSLVSPTGPQNNAMMERLVTTAPTPLGNIQSPTQTVIEPINRTQNMLGIGTTANGSPTLSATTSSSSLAPEVKADPAEVNAFAAKLNEIPRGKKNRARDERALAAAQNGAMLTPAAQTATAAPAQANTQAPSGQTSIHPVLNTPPPRERIAKTKKDATAQRTTNASQVPQGGKTEEVKLGAQPSVIRKADPLPVGIEQVEPTALNDRVVRDLMLLGSLADHHTVSVYPDINGTVILIPSDAVDVVVLPSRRYASIALPTINLRTALGFVKSMRSRLPYRGEGTW